ncbi:MAG TPA: 4Fe-4S binding protein [Clostridiales bacterium]|nr:4Fe-4S binding protein [Clostridiales bacterium]
MKRKIVKIDENKCNGCGICVNACHEGALQLIDGKAKLVSESYCDGLGACLPACPEEAIIIEERIAEAFDSESICGQKEENNTLACGCPGSHAKSLERKTEKLQASPSQQKDMYSEIAESQLRQWPVQIKLVPVNAPYFKNAHLLVAADCTAYAYANIHNDFMRNKITLIGCPKLDDINYAEKLAEILKAHDIKSITVLRMEVPCCGGIVYAVKQAMLNSGKMIPWNVVTISTNGDILEE